MGSRRGVKVTYKVNAETANRIDLLAEWTHRSKTGVVEAAVARLWESERRPEKVERRRQEKG